MKSRLLLYNILISFVLTLIITGIFYITTTNRTITEKTNILGLEVERSSVFIGREFSKIYETTQALQLTTLNVIEETTIVDGRDFLINIAEDTIDNNSNIIGVNYIFEPDVIGLDADYVGNSNYQYDGQFITYVSKQSGHLETTYITNYDDYEMYYRAISLQDDFFTEPYYFNVQGEELFISTVVFPILVNGEYLGLVGIDFTAEYILNQLTTLESSYQRRDIIVSQDGVILLNTDDETSFGEHISTIHSDYFVEIPTIESTGSIEGIMPSGNYEAVYRIDLGGTGESWYIFSDVERSEILGDIYQSAYISIGSGIILFALYLVALYFLTTALTSPIIELTSRVKTFDINKDSVNDVTIRTRGLMDIQLLMDAFRKNYSMIQESMEDNQKEIALKSNQLTLRTTLNTKGMNDLANQTILTICKQTNSILGAIYIQSEDKFILTGHTGISKFDTTSYTLGEGLVGQVAKSKEMLILNQNIDHPVLDFGFKTSTPPNLLIVPIVLDDITIAVIELVSLSVFTDKTKDYLETMSFAIANSIIRERSSQLLNNLYQETRKLADELEEQQEELRLKNEEMEAQQEELRVTNEELETQQEELRVTNKELEFNLKQIEEINTELEKTKFSLQERTMEAERSNKSKSTFLANMSHELRTPLNSIIILSNLIKDHEQSSPKLKEYAATIHDAGGELLALINGILDLSKIESGKSEIANEKWTINDDLVEFENRFTLLCQDKGITFELKKPTGRITLQTDPNKIKTILQNLLSNAVKFTSKGSVVFEVINRKNEVEFHVTDTGIGISSEQIDVIFDEFKQVDSSDNRSYSGSGLGLAICKRYADMLHARIHVESSLNKGSRFTLIVPKLHSNDPKESPTKTTHHESKRAENGQQEDSVIPDDRHRISRLEKTILIIDDDDETLIALRDYFNQQKYAVIVTNTGENGLFLADYYRPNLIILDYRLPLKNGDIIADKLMINDRTKNIPIVIISGDKNIYKGELPFYPKPLSADSLIDIQKHILNVHETPFQILIVEDDELHLRSMVEFVDTHKDNIDLNIDTSTTMRETLVKIEQTQYSLLIVDLTLSDTQGFDLVKQIRKIKNYKKVPIIVYTGKRFTVEEEQELNQYVDDIIIKAGRSPERLLTDIQLFLEAYEQKSIKTDKTIFTSKTVMIVDDDIRNIFALTGLLETYDIKVVFETSGQKAIDKLKLNEPVDLILMDIMMPEMDGYDTMKHIRKITKYKDIPIIALTAKTMRGDREKCIQAGATEYLSKPLNKEKLFSVLRVWLQ